MYDRSSLLERLSDILDVLERIPRRFSPIKSPNEFLLGEEGQDRLDAICMSLIAIGEAFKQVDMKTNGEFLFSYPEIEWRGVIGVRNVIAHGYFDVDVEQVFDICSKDIPKLIKIVRTMIESLNSNPEEH